ncbi:hypothetical protein LguiB_032008 [Lonicera macranthoides]
MKTPKSAQYFQRHNFLLGTPNDAILKPKLKRISRATTSQFSILSNLAISESEITTQNFAVNKGENSSCILIWAQNHMIQQPAQLHLIS